MITRIYVDNFRCLVNFECHLGPLQLLLGRNGAGKSSLFHVLCLLRDFCIYGHLADPLPPESRFGRASRTRWQDSAEQIFELDVAGNGGLYQFRLVVDSSGPSEKPRVVVEEVKFNKSPLFSFEGGEVRLFNDQAEQKAQYPFDWHRSALATIAERKDNSRLSWFKRWFGSLQYVQPNPWAMDGIANQEAERPNEFLSNFVSWYRHIRQETEDHDYIVDLCDVIDGFRSMRLEGAGEGRRELKIRMGEGNGKNGHQRESEYLLSELSEGQRVLIGIYGVLHFVLNSGATVCFDEPDNFISLREVQPWLMKVIERTEDESGAQVLIASHHPELLNRMAFQEGLLLDRPQGRHTRVRKFDDGTETGLSAAELVARGWENE